MATETNSRKRWTPKQEQRLIEKIDTNTPTRTIARNLGRSVEAIRKKAAQLGKSLPPSTEMPTTRRTGR